MSTVTRLLTLPRCPVLLLTPEHGAEKSLLFFHGVGESGQTILDNSTLADLADAWRFRIVLPSLEDFDNTREFVAETLLPSLRDTLPGELWLGGISMGAYVALAAGLQPRNHAAGILCISGAFHMRRAAQFCRICGLDVPAIVTKKESCPGENVRRLLEQSAGHDAPPLYFACGEGDFFYDTNVRAAARARELGYDTRWESVPGLHNWDYWRVAIPPALQWAAGKAEACYDIMYQSQK